VLVEYPLKGSHAYGFITAYATLHQPGGERKVAHVMVPTVPIPTTGYVLVVPVEDLIYLDITVDAAVRVLVSGGAIASGQIRTRSPGVPTSSSRPSA
jgi:uncharacterized membrane protein